MWYDLPTTTLAPGLTDADLKRAESGLEWRVGDLLFGRYLIEGIRSGAMGAVHLCSDETGAALYAIKTVTIDPLLDDRARTLMKSEAESWLRLGRHPNIVRCESVIQNPRDKRLWLLLERIVGTRDCGASLREWMQRGLDSEALLRIVGGIAEGMAFVHAKGLMHRDLKPENVLVTPDGFAKVTDMGLAGPLQPQGDGTPDAVRSLAGTSGYMAPEAWSPGGANLQSDVYAFGVVLWELLAGAHPFREHMSSTHVLRDAHINVTPADPRQLNASAPGSLALLALACLEKHPQDRPDFGAILRRLRADSGDLVWSPAPSDAATDALTEVNQIFSLITMGDYDLAEKRLAVALAAQPDSVHLHAARMNVFIRTGRAREAVDSMERVAAEESAGAADFLLRSTALRGLGRFDEALAALDGALALEPRNRYALEAKGQLLVDLGRTAEAMHVLEHTAATTAGWQPLLLMAQLLGREGLVEEAGRWLRQAIERNPDSEEALSLVAREAVAQGTGTIEFALECLERAARINPDYTRAWTLRAEILEDQGRVAEAEAVLRECLRRKPGDPLAAVALALLIYHSGRVEDATECMLAAARSQPRDADEFVAKGLALRAIGYWVDALNCFESALSLEPAHARTLSLKAAVLSLVGAPAAAAESYRQALATYGESDALRRDLEAVEALLAGDAVVERDPEAALVEYERACAIDPDHPAFGYARISALSAMHRDGTVLTLADPLIAHVSGTSTEQMMWRVRVEFIKVRALMATLLRQDARELAESMVQKMLPGNERERLEDFLRGDFVEVGSRAKVGGMWHREANRLMREGKLDETEDCFRRAIYADRNEAAHLAGLGSCLLMMSGRKPGALEESLALFERALIDRPDDPVVLFNYASALLSAGRQFDALDVAQRLLEVTPDDPDLHDLIRRIRERCAIH